MRVCKQQRDREESWMLQFVFQSILQINSFYRDEKHAFKTQTKGASKNGMA